MEYIYREATFLTLDHAPPFNNSPRLAAATPPQLTSTDHPVFFSWIDAQAPWRNNEIS